MAVSPPDLVERLRSQYFADGRFTHADLHVEQQNGTVTISGTVLDRPAVEFFLGVLFQHAPTVNWRDEMTPLVAGPDYSWALAKRAVMDVRREPSNGAERVTQIIFGEPVEVLRRSGNWAFIRGHDGYLGWTHGEPLHTCSAEAVHDWSSAVTHVVRQPLLACYVDASGEPHQQVMLLPFGARLHVEGTDGAYCSIRCPDSVLRWVPATGLLPSAELMHSGIDGLRTIVNWAQALIGVPYLWGGKTPFGYDCSGLVQMLYSMIGVDLRRDADQQAAQGHVVPFDEICFGDCLFFDTNASEAELHAPREQSEVTHVALAIDGQEFLHASRRHGGVVRGSFDPHSAWYIPTYRQRFLGARRYL